MDGWIDGRLNATERDYQEAKAQAFKWTEAEALIVYCGGSGQQRVSKYTTYLFGHQRRPEARLCEVEKRL